MAKKKNCGCTEKPWRRPPDYEPDEEWLPRCCPEEFVVEYDSIESFPHIGEKLKLYISTSDNSLYIWKEAEQPEVGGQYVKISNVLELGITHNDAADGYFGNQLNNVLWSKNYTYNGLDVSLGWSGDAAFQPGIYTNITRGCPNFLVDGTRKWLTGSWTFLVISGYNKDQNKYHVNQIAFYNNLDDSPDEDYLNIYVRHIVCDSLYTWEGNPGPTFDEWVPYKFGSMVAQSITQLFKELITTKNGAITTPELSNYTLEFGTYTENKIAAKYATTTTGGAMSPEDKIKLDYLSNVSTLVIQPDFDNHIVTSGDKTAIENFFKKNKNFGGLLARNIISYDTSTSPYLTEWQLIGARHYTFHLEYVGGNLYNIELTIYFETQYIILSYTNVDLTNGFEAYGLTRTELGL